MPVIRLVPWFVGSLVGWSVIRSVGWLVCRLVGESVDWLAAAEIQFPRWGGGGGGAKLHEFPTLHRFARFTIAYCFTKTTLGHI